MGCEGRASASVAVVAIADGVDHPSRHDLERGIRGRTVVRLKPAQLINEHEREREVGVPDRRFESL